MEMLKRQHSGLLSEAKDRTEQPRLDDKKPDVHESDDEESIPRSPDGMHTPDSLISVKSTSDEGQTSDGKSTPSSPGHLRRHKKASHSQPPNTGAVIVEHKSGRILGVTPKSRPSILPSEIAARVVETGRKNGHPDSGYMSMCQDDVNGDLEKALMNARITLGRQPANERPSERVAQLVSTQQEDMRKEGTHIQARRTGESTALSTSTELTDGR